MTLNDTQIFERMAARYGLTADQLRAKLAEELVEAEPSPQVAAGGGSPRPQSPQKQIAGAVPRAKPIDDASEEAANPEPRATEDPAYEAVSPEMQASAQLARQERIKLLPEYQQYYFLEDLPPVDPEDPWNQGIYMRFRLNQMRYAQGKEPVGFDDPAAAPAPEATEEPAMSQEGETPAPAPETPPVTEETPPAPAPAPSESQEVPA